MPNILAYIHEFTAFVSQFGYTIFYFAHIYLYILLWTIFHFFIRFTNFLYGYLSISA